MTRQGQLTIESSNSDLDNVLVTYSQVESSIRTSSCGFELLVAIKAIVLHCNYVSNYSLINEKHSQLQAIFALFHSSITK